MHATDLCTITFDACPAPCEDCGSVPCCCKAPTEADAYWSPSVPCPLCGVYASVDGLPCGVCREADVA